MLSLILFAIIMVLGMIRYFTFRKSRKRLEKLINQFPGPRAYPLVGNMHMFIGTPTDILSRCKRLLKYKSPFRIWLMHKPILLVSDPENFQIVANKAPEKGDGYGFIKDFIGDGLITASGEKWKKNRRLLNPAFNPHLLHKHFLRVFNEENGKLIELLDIETEKGKQYDLWPLVIRCTLNTISLTAMNYRDEQEKGLYQYGDSLLQASLLVTKRIYKPWLHPQILYDMYKRLKGYDKLLDHVHTLPRTIIKRKKEELKNRSEISYDINFNFNKETGKKNKTFIDILLTSPESKLHLSEDQIADEVVTIMLVGSETTALTVCTTLQMLAINPHYQDKVYEEIHNVLGDHEGEARIEHLNDMPFLEQCIKETLRRFSVAPFIFRDVTEDIELNDGRIIPAGTTVCLAIVMLHLNRDVYPDPWKWNPNNFSPEAIASRHYCSFVPFSHGPRSCIGYKYAMLSIKVTLVTLLRRYKFSSDAKITDYKPSFDMVLRNLKGYYIRSERRRR